jgi:Uma2 family endonuclease
MTEPAQSLYMTVDQFLGWSDGSDTRYELVEGQVVAMAPAADRHGSIAGNIWGEINRGLEGRPPCRGVIEAGVWIDERNYFVPDVAATCAEPSDSVAVVDPFLIVEVVSPSNFGTEMMFKVQAYIKLPSVIEIWAVDSTKRWFQLWRRGGPDSWIVGLPLTGDASFDSPTLADRVSLDRLYRNTGL